MTTTMWPMGRPTTDASYVIATSFRDFVAFAMGKCWLSHDPEDCNADCNMVRPFTTDDVKELREHFLDNLETTIAVLWTGAVETGSGDQDGDTKSVIIDGDQESKDATYLDWFIRLDNDAIMMELVISGCDSESMWLSYDAIQNRKEVVKVLTEARQFVSDNEVFVTLLEAAK